MSEHLLVGGNLAMLVAAADLVARGHGVRLLTDGAAPGGYFRGSVVEGETFDNGMVLIERRTEAGGSAADEPTPYAPSALHDWTRFGQRVDDWLTGRVELRRAPSLEVSVDGRRWPDHLLSNRLDVFGHLGTDDPAPFQVGDARHPAVKSTSPTFDEVTYGELAPLVHGARNHAHLITPFARKVLGPSHEHVLARHHRSGWLPLYWPESVASARAGLPVGMPEYPFWSVAGGTVSDVVAGLVGELADSNACEVDTSPVVAVGRDARGWQVRTAAAGRGRASRLAVGLTPARLHEVSGGACAAPVDPPAANGVDLVYCLVRATGARTPVSCLLVTESHLDVYRLTDQDVLAGTDRPWHRVVLEARTRGASVTGAVPGLVGELCALLGVDAEDVRVLGARRAERGIPLLSAPVVEADAARAAATVAWARDAPLSGSLLGLHVTSMNDQIVQGLEIAEELS
ncbi:hypothetical protein AB2L28_15805 [Kineococcus sp. TBRC 1896]|uniref:NAD(P)-binding protein n=1 Tax=Kineococcus mangrovi TaxID=1660183 RepID=A0ABV4I4T1_9ACTN